MKYVLVTMIISVCLVACSTPYSTNDKQQYLSSRNGPLLVVPSPLTRSNMSNFYDLPPQNGDPKVSVAPPIVEQVQ